MKTNTKRVNTARTHEGAPAQSFPALQELKRTAATCLLFEPTFYEGGNDIADRLAQLSEKVSFQDLADTVLWCRNELNLRHVSLFLAVLAMRKDVDGSLKRALVRDVIQRADELMEIVSLYWTLNGRKAGSQDRPAMPNAMKKGIADAFAKFDEYQFSKWDSRGKAIRLRDVMFLTHPKPVGDARAALYNRIAEDKMAPANTWETNLSAGKDKKDTFSTLMAENKLGAMALLRNLRNMVQSGVDRKLVREALAKANWSRVLPFRFLSALETAPEFESALDKAFLASCKGVPRLGGDALILIDVSGSMGWGGISPKSTVTPAKAAFCLGAIAKEIFDDAVVYGYDHNLHGPYAGRGLALTKQRTPGGATYPGKNLERASQKHNGHVFDYVFLITDEQAHDMVWSRKYGRNQIVINVQPYQNGLKLSKNWLRLNGWSERIFDFLDVVQKIDRGE